jgi:hypothetical protein
VKIRRCHPEPWSPKHAGSACFGVGTRSLHLRKGSAFAFRSGARRGLATRDLTIAQAPGKPRIPAAHVPVRKA